MKVLITGAAGFIARNLYEQLRDKFDIKPLCRKELDLLDAPAVFNLLKNGRFDIVIHTATYDAAPKHSTKDPAKVLENNLKMFFNIARCKEYFKKMIYFGSGAEFGRENWVPQMKEDYFDRFVPPDQYGFSKYIMAKYAQANKGIYNLRLFGVFGKYEDWRVRFISNACCQAVCGMKIKINQDARFDFLYIDDLVRITEWFLRNTPKHNIYNICTGKVYDFHSLAEKIIEVSGKKLEIEIQKEGFRKEYSADNSLLLKELKGFKFTPIDEALKDLYNWYDSNKHIIDKETL